LQAPIALFKQFDVTLADVCLFVTGPEVPQNFQTFRSLEVRAAKPPEDIETTVLVRRVIQNRVQAVLQRIRLEKLLAGGSVKE